MPWSAVFDHAGDHVPADHVPSDRGTSDRWTPERGTPDRGQATVELALAMPVLCLLLLGIVQVALVVRDQLRLIDTARLAARAASVAADPGAAAADTIGPDPPSGLRIVTDLDNSTVSVAIYAVSITEVPLIGMLVPDIEISARSTMVLEPP